ncbi:ABC transporter permease [Nocardia sp. alder85J]|uniref:ABC transporter permease n=1 Tax=Nocardia sp. alder85J TaxID=2862949 RepID=UPI001CD3E849|nr:ABC transporter permease [Nocardia sp. alder85J]MCX4098212.1 ABC transporter permease [Nocardia sp. alder85J]
MTVDHAEIRTAPMVTPPRPAAARRGRLRTALSRRNLAILAGQLLVVAAVLGLLQWLVDSGRVGAIYLASPTQILHVFPHLITQEHLFGNLLITLYEAAVGTVLAFALGVTTGIWMGLSRTGERFFNPFIAAAMAVPKVTIIPLLTLYLGVGVDHKIVIVLLFGYFLFVFNTIAGIRQVQENHLKVARAHGASRWQIVFKVILPSAAPSIVAALRVETGTALVAALFGEIIASKAGLGNMLNRAIGVYDTATLFALVLSITVFSVLVIAAVDLLEKKVLLRWKYA